MICNYNLFVGSTRFAGSKIIIARHIMTKKKHIIFIFLSLIITFNSCNNNDDDFTLNAYQNKLDIRIDTDPVTINEAKKVFNDSKNQIIKKSYKQNISSTYNKNSFEITADWSSAQYQDAILLDDKMIIVNAKTSWNIPYGSRLIFYKINGKTISYLYTEVPITFDNQGHLKDFKIFLHNLNGEFEKGILIKEYILSNEFIISEKVKTGFNRRVKRQNQEPAFWIHSPPVIINNNSSPTLYPDWTRNQWNHNLYINPVQPQYYDNNGFTNNNVNTPPQKNNYNQTNTKDKSRSRFYLKKFYKTSSKLSEEEQLEIKKIQALEDYREALETGLKPFTHSKMGHIIGIPYGIITSQTPPLHNNHIDAFSNVSMNTKMQTIGIYENRNSIDFSKNTGITNQLYEVNEEKYNFNNTINFSENIPEQIKGLNYQIARIASKGKLYTLDNEFINFMSRFRKNSNHNITEELGKKFIIQKQLHRDDSTLKNYWRAASEYIHLSLQIGGVFTGLGDLLDVVDGAIYMVEGDFYNAKGSFMSIIPGIGHAIAAVRIAKIVDPISKTYKLCNLSLRKAEKILKESGEIYTKTKISSSFNKTKYTNTIFEIADGRKIVHFGNRNKARTGWKGIIKVGEEAHHILLAQLSNHPLIQNAALGKNFFNIHHPDFTLPLPNKLHRKKHLDYSNSIKLTLNKLYNKTGNDPEKCYKAAKTLADECKYLFSRHPDANMKDIGKQLESLTKRIKL